MAYDFLVVGAGLTGCVLAEKLATYGYKILLIDKRLHVGGNCCDHWEDGILVQDYGPHIFHTNDEHVFRYLSRFTRWNNYRHKVVSFRRGKYFPIPINLTTINLFFGCEFRSWAQVDELLKSKRVKIRTIRNSRDVVVSRFGEDLYKAFVRGYTKKQWDFYPEELSPDVLKRLPLRSNNSPYYYNDP
ncbi:MAG TPA: NAD(P)-binding protein, partial [Candidatus Omnitrophota bacterium]|nr:NAD(P)-binding protein [Candidatus Omnitrophota bacterium]